MKKILIIVILLIAFPLCLIVWAGLDAAGGKIINVATPIAATDAANKQYVDNMVAGGTHNLLSATHNTAVQTVSRGSLIYGDSDPNWNELTIGASGTLLRSDGTDVSWAATTNITSVGTLTALSVNSGATNTALSLVSTDAAVSLIMADDATTPDNPMAMIRIGNDLLFYSGDDEAEPVSSSIERIRIKSDGKVGIGTNAPTAVLDINSDVLRLRTAKTPASPSSSGNEGDICWNDDYFFVRGSTQWKRAALSTWAVTDVLLLETGDKLFLETGNAMLLEG